jgi:hypothetical protein
VVHSASEPDSAQQGWQACKIGRCPILGQTCCVFEDAIAHREPALTGEAPYRRSEQLAEDGLARGNPSNPLMTCRVADEPVVVMKSRPVKPGNSVEVKTGMTASSVWRACGEPKAVMGCEGVKQQLKGDECRSTRDLSVHVGGRTEASRAGVLGTITACRRSCTRESPVRTSRLPKARTLGRIGKTDHQAQDAKDGSFHENG